MKKQKPITTLYRAIKELENIVLSRDSVPTSYAEYRKTPRAERVGYYKWLRQNASWTASFHPPIEQLK